jgi:Cyclopropane fatty acid synthase and related methyltransferases
MKNLPMKQFPLSSKYDADWILENEMGPCSMWLCEWLMEKMDLKSGDRVLDMGCGKGMTSVFLAKEYGVNVVANDLWIPAGDNWRRFKDAGVADKVIPIHAEAHDLPYADEYFDAVISVDSYHYYGTDILYLDYITRFLKPDGQIGIAVPGLKNEFNPLVPERMEQYWTSDLYTFHTSWWWKQLWEYSKNIEVLHSQHMTDGWDVWRHWEKDIIGADLSGDMLAMLEADGGEYMTFVRTVGRKKDFLKMIKKALC